MFVSDIKRSVKFYQDVFNVKANWDGGPYADFILDNNYQIMLYGRGNFEEMISQKLDYPANTNGTMELALDYPRFTDVDNEFERIEKLGATSILKPITTSWGQRTCFLADPDGNLIEIGSFGKEC